MIPLIVRLAAQTPFCFIYSNQPGGCWCIIIIHTTIYAPRNFLLDRLSEHTTISTLLMARYRVLPNLLQLVYYYFIFYWM